jgi:hypothetical protein
VLLLSCRYYGLSPKEEAAHLRHVKRYAKGLFHNIKGDADRWEAAAHCVAVLARQPQDIAGVGAAGAISEFPLA